MKGIRKKFSKNRGISVRYLNMIMAALIIVFSVLLLFATYRAKHSYQHMRESTQAYIVWQRSAYELQSASDYLTEQVRCFTETGDRQYLDNYFHEADVDQHRDRAVESIHTLLGDSEADLALRAAMDESVSLMDREYYAMRLTLSAYGLDPADFPDAVRYTVLKPEDAALPPEKQEALARSMVFDSEYHRQKETISSNMDHCLAELISEIDARQNATADKLQNLLIIQRVLLIATISITFFTMLLTLLLVISPLLRAVVYIRADEPIPIRGSNEFQFLAKTYNIMYESNREQKEQLAFEATHDALTGIYNRSGYDFFLNNTDWNTSALLLFDVDKFKRVNDTYGHEMGDHLLKRVAGVLTDSFRSQDRVCRIGGDEFAIIMVHIKPETERMIRDKVQRINQTLQQSENGIPPVHLSCGAAYGHQHADVEALFHTADAALYRVKSNGGNGCEVVTQSKIA